MKKIKLPIHNIEVETDGQGSGTITSSLKDENVLASNHPDPDAYAHNAALDAVESMILACACAGVDIKSNAFVKAVSTTVDAVNNTYGD